MLAVDRLINPRGGRGGAEKRRGGLMAALVDASSNSADRSPRRTSAQVCIIGLRRDDRMARNAVASEATALKPPAGKALAEGTIQELISAAPSLKRLVVQARERGVVTVDEINAALPEEEISPDQFDELIAMFEEMGVSVGRDEDGNGAAASKVIWSRPTAKRPTVPPRSRKISGAPTIPSACICARWAPSSCSRARARSRSPSASRRAATWCSKPCARARSRCARSSAGGTRSARARSSCVT